MFGHTEPLHYGYWVSKQTTSPDISTLYSLMYCPQVAEISEILGINPFFYLTSQRLTIKRDGYLSSPKVEPEHFLSLTAVQLAAHG